MKDADDTQDVAGELGTCAVALSIDDVRLGDEEDENLGTDGEGSEEEGEIEESISVWPAPPAPFPSNLQTPITNPEKVICVRMNYVDHCLEQNVKIPKEPIIFSKFSSFIGVNWEVELAFVMKGRKENTSK
ncbi:hypothetical protein JD844_031990 [Phrynosoma platyrhinos]|uniref:Uncharacterized protein n=1 Tax=Phrynosoma platyrhinos TaxID=52577 RepID=A0ABQ7T427_PHRPL|nr:hypothetical protein JD844_031990 [Phrynosoma platyrhinos]